MLHNGVNQSVRPDNVNPVESRLEPMKPLLLQEIPQAFLDECLTSLRDERTNCEARPLKASANLQKRIGTREDHIPIEKLEGNVLPKSRFR